MVAESQVNNTIPKLVPNFGALKLSQTLSLLQNREYMTETLSAASELVKIDQGTDHYQDALADPVKMEVMAMAKLTNGSIQAMDVLPGNKFLMAACDDQGEVGIWLGLNRCVNLRPHSRPIRGINFQTEKSLFMSCEDGYVKEIDLESQKLTVVLEKDDFKSPELDEILWQNMLEDNLLMFGHQSHVTLKDKRSKKLKYLLEDLVNGNNIEVRLKQIISRTKMKD